MHKFTNASGDGGTPYSGLVFDGTGNLYGVTSEGGVNGYGTIYKLSPAGSTWNYSVVYSFGIGYDGRSGAMVFDPSGTFYGTTLSGGYGVNSSSGGYGTVFAFTP